MCVRAQGKFDLVRSVGEECVTDAELAMLMARKPDSFVLYDGFEPSGRMHIAQVSHAGGGALQDRRERPASTSCRTPPTHRLGASRRSLTRIPHRGWTVAAASLTACSALQGLFTEKESERD